MSYPRNALFCLMILVGMSIAPLTQAELIDHSLHLTIRHSSGTMMAIPPSITALEVTAPNQVAPGQAGNPLYEGQTVEGQNVLYEGGADPGSSGSVIGISFTLGETNSRLHADGIIHRDIAARNFAVHTEEGTYEAPIDSVFYFTNEGPENLRGVGPVRWMAPESLRTRTYGTSPISEGGVSTVGAQTGYWELVGGSFYFEASYPVPEPTSFVMLTLGAVCLVGRRGREWF